METGRVNSEKRIGSVVAVSTGTCDDPGLLFSDKFVEVLKEADQDDQERAGNSHKEYPGEDAHHGVGKSEHTGIVNQGPVRDQN